MGIADQQFPQLDEEPRAHHYMFAHVALRQIVLGLKARRTDLHQLGESELFHGLWDEVGERVASQGQGEALASGGMSVQTLMHGELSALLLILPPAQRMAEALAIAVVRVPVKRFVVFRDYALRYLTLELGARFDGDKQPVPRTVLCEWTADGAHHNMGDGPEPEQFGARALALCSPATD